MARIMDYMISPQPIRISNVGHLPGRILFREKAVFEKWAAV